MLPFFSGSWEALRVVVWLTLKLAPLAFFNTSSIICACSGLPSTNRMRICSFVFICLRVYVLT